MVLLNASTWRMFAFLIVVTSPLNEVVETEIPPCPPNDGAGSVLDELLICTLGLQKSRVKDQSGVEGCDTLRCETCGPGSRGRGSPTMRAAEGCAGSSLTGYLAGGGLIGAVDDEVE